MVRVGMVMGCHLVKLCREEYPLWSRLILWVMVEIALIRDDIQEVIDNAIVLKILTNGSLPLWVGMLITSLEVEGIGYPFEK
jgi:NRAMP (natural resistance-associated macrophage protein)-like metal ion transporter